MQTTEEKRETIKTYLETGEVKIKDVVFLLAMKNFKIIDGLYFTQWRLSNGESYGRRLKESEVLKLKERHVTPNDKYECQILEIVRG